MSKRGSSRARRERRKEDRDVIVTATPAKAVKPVRRRVEKVQARATTAPARASTFEVARAHRQLADDLPSVVHQRSKAPDSRKATVEPEPQRQATRVQTAAKARPARERDEPRESLKLEKPPQTACKAKPESTKGNGGSRAFVPWCR